MRRLPLLPACALALLLAGQSAAGVLYQQAQYPSGGFYPSSWWDPDGSNYDQYVWDAFTLAQAAEIHTVGWRGCYDPAYGGATPVRDFTIAIYASIAAGSQPDVGHPPLVEYTSGGAAGESYAGVFGGMTMYDYRFRLPAAFPAAAGVKYWVQIEAWQWGFPGWSLARGQGGDGSHFRCLHNNDPADEGVPTGCQFATITGDVVFSLLTDAATGVEGGPTGGPPSLAGTAPSPCGGDRLEVSFTLPDARPAELSLFDVAGRRVRSAEVGGFGAGAHRIDLAAAAPLEPGIYLVRLAHPAGTASAKVIVTPALRGIR